MGEPCSRLEPCDHHKDLYCDSGVLSETETGTCKGKMTNRYSKLYARPGKEMNIIFVNSDQNMVIVLILKDKMQKKRTTGGIGPMENLRSQ